MGCSIFRCLGRACNERSCSVAALSLMDPLPLGLPVDDLEVPLLLLPLLDNIDG